MTKPRVTQSFASQVTPPPPPPPPASDKGRYSLIRTDRGRY